MSPLKKILIVDDDPDIGHFLKEALLKNGYESVVATNGPEAIEKSKKVNFDLILLDIRMPFFSGFWFCNAFKERKETKNIPVIMMSSQSDDYTVKKAQQLGAVTFLKKPFQLEELLESVKSTLSH